MKKAVYVILIIGVSLLLVGGTVFVIGMTKLGWDFNALATVDIIEESASFESKDVQEIILDVNTADIKIIRAEDDKITVNYFIVKNKKGEAVREIIPTLSEGKLKCIDDEKNTSFLDLSFTKEGTVIVKIPADKVTTISIKSSTGDVTFGEAGKEVKVTALNITTTTGDITIDGKTLCENNVSIERSTGDITINGELVSGGNVSFNATTGDVKACAPIKAKNIVIKNSTGKVDCTAPIEFDSLDVSVSTGNVSIKASGSMTQYTYSYETSTGDSNLPVFTFGDKLINIHTSTGDIRLYFEE